MPKRRVDDDEWDIHKEDVVRLYIRENQPLKAVMAWMAKERGFKRTFVNYGDTQLFPKLLTREQQESIRERVQALGAQEISEEGEVGVCRPSLP
jgi:hypothetical protein